LNVEGGEDRPASAVRGAEEGSPLGKEGRKKKEGRGLAACNAERKKGRRKAVARPDILLEKKKEEEEGVSPYRSL